jgi:hypothetical protein
MKKLTKANSSHARLSGRGQLLLVALCLAIAWLGFWAYAVLADVPATRIGTEANTLLGSPAPDDVGTRAVTPTMRIDPVSAQVQPGRIFSVAVVIDDVTNLGAFQFDLKYATGIVQPGTDPVSDCVRLGPFLGSNGRQVHKIGPTISEGLIEYAAWSNGSADGPSGSGTLATITLEALDVGTTTLGLQDVTITDPVGTVLAVNVQGGEVTVASGTSVYLPIILNNY